MQRGIWSFRNFGNSNNSGGDTSGRGRRVSNPGGTKPLSMSTRCKGWRPAVGESAPLQQASGSLHDEAWVGRVQSSSEDFPGCGNRTGVCRNGVPPSNS